MEELVIWNDVIGYEDYYLISNTGKILSKRKNKLMSFGDNGRGYLFVYLWMNGLKKRFYVHRLVAIAFIVNKNNKTQVNHIDCNKKNNSVNNLEWVTPEDNIKHAIKNKRFYTSEFQKNQTSIANRGIKSHLCKLSENDIICIKKYLKEKRYTYKEIAIKYNTTQSNIGAINRGKSWKHILI